MEELKAVWEKQHLFFCFVLFCGKTDYKGLSSSVITNMKGLSKLKKKKTLDAFSKIDLKTWQI